MAKGHEPTFETPATAYGDEASMPGRALVKRKTKKLMRFGGVHKRHAVRGRRKGQRG